MATQKAPEGTVRTNIHVNKENYETFKKLSKALSYTFTDLVNDSLVEFNKMISKAVETGDVQSLLDLYSNQLLAAKKELDSIAKEIK